MPSEQDKLQERFISKSDDWCDKAISELDIPSDTLIAMVVRGEETIIPDGKTVLYDKDIVLMYR